MKRYLKIHDQDNVVVALEEFKKLDKLEFNGQSILISENIPVKHKIAIRDFLRGEAVKMYGLTVGRAKTPILKGSRISTENTEHATESFDTLQVKTDWKKPDIGRFQGRTFKGYHRKDGSVGIRNYWIILPLVFCEKRNVAVIQDSLVKALGYQTVEEFGVDTRLLVDLFRSGAAAPELLKADILRTQAEIHNRRVFKNIDGIKILNHDMGCGGTRQDADSLCRLLAGYVLNPNVAGATVLSLGCQNAQVSLFQEALDRFNPGHGKPVYIFEQQKYSSERELIADAVKQTFCGLIEADKIERTPAGLEHLSLGLECGGSDGFSGITANPALGHASDLIVGLGGTTILSEFPELCGAEQDLINRCETPENAEKFARLMKTYSARAEAVGSGFYANPSPGNIRDGLITDAMKSLGAALKGGTAPVKGVLDYTERVSEKGFYLLCTPGGDVESTTAMTSSGCTMIAFTTGLGTPTGNPVAPTIKIATNTALARRMPDIIDLNAGTIVDGADTIPSKGEEILEYVIRVASGEAIPHAERLAQDDFIPWKRGISL
ncbi:MAG TPA: altronate dehydratase family protein [Saprospiraceae bacterium]|nr:altronate dehydratase family protein [Saprospiraceae bacterium]HNT20207.1 altronate dehydratase family protein [Saprospiraceae bacterium]